MKPLPITESLSIRQVLLAAVALVLSISLHGLVLGSFPEVPVGRMPDYAPRPKHESSRLDKVQIEPPEQLQRPDAYRLEGPSAEQARAVAALLPPPVDTSWTPSAQAPEAPSAAAFASTATPEPLPERTAWLPRQEVMQIEESRFEDAEALLPRVLTPDIPREMGTPDFVPPVEVIDFAGTVLPDSAQTPAVDLVAAASSSTAMGFDPGLDMLPEVEMEDTFLEETGEVLDEAPEEISEADAVEDLLKLNITTARADNDPYTYFELQIMRNGPEGLPVLPKDVLIIQDASQSMTQRKLENCKHGILNVLDELNPGDRFNIIAFRDEIEWAFEDWQHYEGAAKARTRMFLEDMKATGKTDVSGSLESIVGLRRNAGRPVIAILVTDGRPTMGLVDSSDIIVRVSEANSGDVSVFALGGGTRVNKFLLDMLSYNNRGDSLVVPEREDIPSALADWAAQLDRPVLTDLRFRFNGLDEAEIFPKTLTHLFLDRPLRIYGRTLEPDRPVAFRIDGLSGPLARDMVFQLDLPPPGRGGTAVREGWAWQKAYALIGEHIRTDSDELMREIRAHDREFSISIPYASEFIPFRF